MDISKIFITWTLCFETSFITLAKRSQMWRKLQAVTLGKHSPFLLLSPDLAVRHCNPMEQIVKCFQNSAVLVLTLHSIRRTLYPSYKDILYVQVPLLVFSEKSSEVLGHRDRWVRGTVSISTWWWVHSAQSDYYAKASLVIKAMGFHDNYVDKENNHRV